MPYAALLLHCGLTAMMVSPALAIRKGHHASLSDASAATPAKPQAGSCGEAEITSVGSMIGCGADGCAWKVTVADGGAAVMKIAKESDSSQKSLEKDCTFANKLEAANVTRAIKCLGSCMADGNKAAVLSPFLENMEEFGPNQIQLGDKNKHAVEAMLTTTWEMLHGGFINGDQANNVLYAPATGEPLFIDFGRAVEVAKPVSIKFKMKYTAMVKNMIYDLVISTVPPELCGFARDTVHQLQEKLPPSEFVAPFVKDAMKVVETRWDASCKA